MFFHFTRRTRLAVALHALLLVAATAACARSGSPSPATGAPPPMGVSTATLQKKPLEQSSGFIATIRSIRSSTVQPEVEGVVTRIFVKSGDRVALGAPLVQIKPDKQEATVRSTEASRAAVEADVQYWTQQVKRLEALVTGGAISRQEFDQAQNSLRTAQARLSALNAQVNEQQVELQYYRVAAPQAGVVGDITIRSGDRVTKSTMITTIDDNSGLEVYIQVPIDRSPDLRLGLPVQILDADGKVLATNPVTFVAPRVDDATQTVLIKSLLREVPPTVRTQQFVRSRIVWRTIDGVTIPITAVTRINGKYFCFVVETSNNGTVARQRPIEVGELLGNDYVVLSGLSAGDQVIVSGIQKIGDGAPVKPQ
ncbi:MAG TPA: efflux RND transporter periplasmic adaptor subunit [Vicinamibacterales bacterium]|jgi:RND family efflux transporter MFP subunit|nr:efflux RND transporter periplasmic adaptor subunit [Vicinamibacterales bacterium]